MIKDGSLMTGAVFALSQRDNFGLSTPLRKGVIPVDTVKAVLEVLLLFLKVLALLLNFLRPNKAKRTTHRGSSRDVR